jgi:hypothetical protein
VRSGFPPPHSAPGSGIPLCVAVFRSRRWGAFEVPESAHEVPQLLDLCLTSSGGRGFRGQPAIGLCPTSVSEHPANARDRMKIEIDLERLADELAALVAKRLEGQIGTPEPSPWMCMADAITYTASRRARSASGWPRGGSPPTVVGAGCSTARSSTPLSATSLRGPIPRRSPQEARCRVNPQAASSSSAGSTRRTPPITRARPRPEVARRSGRASGLSDGWRPAGCATSSSELCDSDACRPRPALGDGGPSPMSLTTGS